MREDYFDDATDTPAASANQEPEKREESDSPTTIMPRSFFEAAGKKPEPGEVCKVRVVAAHEDSVEVEYESDEEPELEEAPMPRSEMSEMMS